MAEDGAEDLQDLYENAPCGYLSLGSDGRIVKVNNTFCEWTGYTKDQVVGKRLRDLLNVAGRMFYETHFAPLMRMQGFFDEVALDILKPNGDKLPILANAREKRDKSGRAEFTRITLFRAAERRRYERELVDARENSEAANRKLTQGLDTERQIAELREQFIAVLGHDLRNPLAAIDAGARMLLRGEIDEKTAKVLRLMRASTSRMSGLIDNVLDFARGRLGGGLGLTREAGRSLEPTLNQVIEEIHTSFPEQLIEAEFNLGAPVNVDHPRIAQLFSKSAGQRREAWRSRKHHSCYRRHRRWMP